MISSFKRLLGLMPGSMLVALSDITIESKDENRLVLSADGCLVAFDKPSQIISYSGKPVASFFSVDSIDITHFTNGKRLEWWVLSLRVRGGKTLAVGRSPDGVQTSIAAAHASTIMGKSVHALTRVGL